MYLPNLGRSSIYKHRDIPVTRTCSTPFQSDVPCKLPGFPCMKPPSFSRNINTNLTKRAHSRPYRISRWGQPNNNTFLGIINNQLFLPVPTHWQKAKAAFTQNSPVSFVTNIPNWSLQLTPHYRDNKLLSYITKQYICHGIMKFIHRKLKLQTLLQSHPTTYPIDH